MTELSGVMGSTADTVIMISDHISAGKICRAKTEIFRIFGKTLSCGLWDRKSIKIVMLKLSSYLVWQP